MCNVVCTVCLSTFSVSHGGKTDITYHMKSNKHKMAQKAALASSKVKHAMQNIRRKMVVDF